MTGCCFIGHWHPVLPVIHDQNHRAPMSDTQALFNSILARIVKSSNLLVWNTLMAEKQGTKTATVVQLRPAITTLESEKKWGKAVMKLGFSILPSLIFRAQRRLGLSPVQLVVLLQIADYWWDQGRKPHPGKTTIGERLDLSARQVQRHIADLEKAGFLKRIERRAPHRGKLTNEYDLTGLVEKLKKLEPEFRQVEEMKRQVRRRGGLVNRGSLEGPTKT